MRNNSPVRFITAAELLDRKRWKSLIPERISIVVDWKDPAQNVVFSNSHEITMAELYCAVSILQKHLRNRKLTQEDIDVLMPLIMTMKQAFDPDLGDML